MGTSRPPWSTRSRRIDGKASGTRDDVVTPPSKQAVAADGACAPPLNGRSLRGLTMDDWEPISRASLDELIVDELAQATPEARALFAGAAVTPEKWQLSPW